MNRFFIGHPLTEEDIVHLSDKDSAFAIGKLNMKVEDILEIENYQSIYLGTITDINGNSVEVEINRKIEDKEVGSEISITVIQSLSNDSKFNFFLEKAVEIGIDRIIPVESKYSLKRKNKAVREYGLWNKIIRDAVEQSRTLKGTMIDRPIYLKDLKLDNDSIKICLATENVPLKGLREYMKGKDLRKQFVIAVGPEKGWAQEDIKYFKDFGFDFVSLEGNILRTETAGLVVGSIIKYLKGEI